MGKVTVRSLSVVGDIESMYEVEWGDAKDYLESLDVGGNEDYNNEIEYLEDSCEQNDVIIELTNHEAYTLQLLLGVVHGDRQCDDITEKLEKLTGFVPECEDYERLIFNQVTEDIYEITFNA